MDEIAALSNFVFSRAKNWTISTMLRLSRLLFCATVTAAASTIFSSCKTNADNEGVGSSTSQFTGEVCFKVNVPDQTASSSDLGIVYIQISGTKQDLSWIGMGTGSSMSGSTMFIIYANGNGNVTLSTREAQGHFMPSYSGAIQAALLDGSGVSFGTLTANIRCEKCPVSQDKWIWAVAPGQAVKNGADRDTSIQQHSANGKLAVNIQNAKGGRDQNPFVGESTGSTPNDTSSNTPNGASSGAPPDTPAPTSKSLSGGAIAGIVVGAVMGLLVILGIFFVIRRRRQKAKSIPIEENQAEWEKPEIDGRSVPFIELPTGRDAHEIEAKPMDPVELPAGTSHDTHWGGETENRGDAPVR
ncbi:unnamed protein product [Periconia digitata]|uniref:DOMON domain-containing protein n=1 Tax=Periconia digitata TaxID=1303443 RepID=A0A9W4UAB5_9PLEO|nr:unnamed protein product [Periconia digitata]